MICPFSKEPCNNPKYFHVDDLINGEIHQLDLCASCFLEHYKILGPEQQLNSIISSILELNKSCSCGLSLLELSKNKRFGCKNCYSFFKNELNIFLKICQDKPIHCGKKPFNEKLEEIDALKEKMKKAIEVENYEIAGILRDKIKELNNL